MASIYGRNIRISIFGQSHSEAVGVVIDGLPAGFKVDFDALMGFMERRAPGRNLFSSQRLEADEPEFLSGLLDGVTCGAPLCAVIRNKDAQPQDYEVLRGVLRPGHADYTAYVKHNGFNDQRGGGHLSGRLTAPLCLAGGICLQILSRNGIEIGAHIADISGTADDLFDPVNVCGDTLDAVRRAEFPVICAESGERMREVIEVARQEGDSLGGIIECAVIGAPAGLGDPMFDGVENRIAAVVFGIPGVRGIEFGNGFVSSFLRGGANNDEFYMDGGVVRTRTNNHGGILGGMTSGMPIIFRAAIKPTPSVALEQSSVRLPRVLDAANGQKGEDTKITISGRHDPCIVPRAVPCIEAAAAIAMLDMVRW